jgi:hypothetical protein
MKRREWPTVRAVAAAILLLCVGFAFAGCGRKEGAVQGLSPADAPKPDAAPAGPGEVSVPAGVGFSVVVAPSAPSRIAPPSVSLKSPPGQGAVLLETRWTVNGSEAGDGQILSPDAFRRGDRIRAEVRLRTGEGERLLATPEVVAVNALPAVTEVRIEPAAPTAGSAVKAVVSAQDPDGDVVSVRFQWHVDDRPVGGDADTLILRGAKKGSWVHVAATPNDGSSDGAWRSSPRHRIVNSPPTVTSDLPKEIPSDRRFAYRIVAEDADGDPLSYTLTKGPPGMSLSGSTLEWQVPPEFLGTNVEAVVVISDGDGGQTVQTVSMTIQPPK